MKTLAASVATLDPSRPMSSPPQAPSVESESGLDARSRLSDFLALTKPRITTMVLVTVATGFLAGVRGEARVSVPTLLLTLAGAGLVASGASALNQWLERDRDFLMRRTRNRPLPGKRVSPLEALAFGVVLALLGLEILLAGVNLASALVALATLILYAFVYTPLKPVTTLNTAIGAVPGALPPVIGWAAATGGIGIEALALFLILFLWQFPHFLAIAWIHREDYARGGHRMLPSVDPSGVITGRQAALHALALIPVGLLPSALGIAGSLYFAGALAMGIYYLLASIRFWSEGSDRSARQLLRASILYLPVVLLLLLLNPLP